MKTAFSLVELSIVLVILGLLTGGILAGKSLIRASELRSLSTDFAKYQTAIHAFRDRYFALPGDFASASNVWSDCLTYTRNSCSGNGDGSLNVDNCGTNRALERYRAWQHLGFAGLVEGSALPLVESICTANTGQDDAQVGQNVPALKLANAGMLLGTSTTTNALYLRAGATFSSHLQAGILKQEEAWNIDSKIDDGKPSSGKLIGTTGHPVLGQNFCLNGTEYYLSRSDSHCLLTWYFQ